MKNVKFTKFFVLVMALTLLIGSAVGVAISANETVTPEILGVNIKYGADLRFMVAVDAAELGTEADVTVNIYDKVPAEGVEPVNSVAAEYTNTSDTNLGVDNAYVATSGYGISAIAMGQSFYITAEANGVESEAVEYSAVKYFLERLYADGIINATEGMDLVRKEHYENAIAYGSTAQKVVGDEKTNVADYIYVMAQDGTVNGSTGAVAVKGDALNFTYTGTEDVSGLAYWLDPNGDKSSVASVSGTYTPKFAHFTFNELSANTTVTTNSSTNWVASTFADGDADVSKYTKLLYTKKPSGYETSRTHEVTANDGKLTYSAITGGTYFALENRNNVESNANYTNFESEVTIALGEGRTFAVSTVDFQINTSNMLYRMYMQYNSSEGSIEVWFQRNKYATCTYIDSSGTERIGYDTSHVKAWVAKAGDTSATFDLRFESYYIADNNLDNNEDANYNQALDRDSVFVVTINNTPLYILDSRGVDKSKTPTYAEAAAFKNSDEVYVCQHGYTSTSATDATVRAGLFKFISFNPNSGNVCDISFDNIIFESKAVETVPTFNITAP